VTTKPVPVRYSGRRPRISTWQWAMPYFLFGLAQGGGFGRGVAVLAAPAGKADLAAMIAQVRGALGQQHGGTGFAHDHRHQHGGGNQFPVFVKQWKIR
jgi:hypothetical protein